MRHLAVLLLVIAACSSGAKGPASSAGRECSTTLGSGKPTVIADFECMTGNTIHGSAFLHCVDGRELRWNDFAWAYVGEPAHLFTGAEPTKTPPDEEFAKCRDRP